MTLLRRAELAEPDTAVWLRKAIAEGKLEANEIGDQLNVTHDAKAGHVFGRMELADLLIDPQLRPEPNEPRSDEADEQSRRRYEAGRRYATEHLTIYGTGTAPSHLRNLITGMGVQSQDGRDDTRLEAVTQRLNRKYADAMTTPPAGRLLGQHVLHRAVLQETALDDPRDQATLRRVLDRIGAAKRQERFHEGHPELEAGFESTPQTAAKPRRQRGLPVEFYAGQVERTAEERSAIAASVAKLRRIPVAGDAD
jgi:hypothetical protein